MESKTIYLFGIVLFRWFNILLLELMDKQVNGKMLLLHSGFYKKERYLAGHFSAKLVC
jgi:hypothetical protein